MVGILVSCCAYPDTCGKNIGKTEKLTSAGKSGPFIWPRITPRSLDKTGNPTSERND